jgi:hypothetical protein
MYYDLFIKSWSCHNPESHPFFAEREKHYDQLAKLNLEKITQITDSQDLISKFNKCILTKDESLYLRKLIEASMYKIEYDDFPNVYNIIEGNNQTMLQKLNNDNLSRITAGKSYRVESLLDKNIGLILVRPEIYHIKDLVKDFLETKNFQVIYSADKTINFSQYWGLYNHAFADPIKSEHVRRRSFGYIDRPCELILFTDRTKRNQNIKLSDWIKNNLKGNAGVYNKNTLRGGIIYAEMSMVRMGFNPKTSQALDPLNLYSFDSKESYKYANSISTVLANLPGVHIPEGHEIEKDLNILLSLDELNNL